MNLKFETINKKPYNSEIEKVVWETFENGLKDSMTKKIESVRGQLTGIDILISIDMQNSTAKISSDNIPEEKMELVKKAIHSLE